MKNLFGKFMGMLVVCLLAISAFFLTGCNKNKGEYLVIGFSGPLTGGAAVYGQAVLNSAQLAVDEINEAGGVNGYKLKLISRDDMHDATKVSTNYADLLEEGMQVSLGCVTTKPCLEFAKLSAMDGVFFLTPSATGDAVVEKDNAYQMCFADTRQGTFSARYVNENVSKTTKIGVLYRSGDEYSEGIYNNFMSELDKAYTVEVASFSEDTPSDLKSQVNKLKDCKFIFLPIYYTPASTFLNDAKGIIADDAIYFGCDGLDGIDGTIEGFNINSIPQEVSYLSHFNSNSTSGPAKDFIDKYVKKYNANTLNQFGASAYDCIYAIAQALKNIAAKNPDAVTPSAKAADLGKLLKAEFQGGFTFSGITGSNITWDKDGFVNKSAVKYIVKEMNK